MMIAADTKQVKDYSRFNWTLFDVEAKIKRHDEFFSEELAIAKAAGNRLVK